MKLSHLPFLLLLFCQCSSNIVEPGQDQTSDQDLMLAETKIIWHWEDEFNPNDQDKLKLWLNEITDYTMKTLGAYQFDLHYYFYLSDGNEPVPFAHTSRHKNKQSVHFYVNPIFTIDDFLNDWTAQHEISHLSIPFVGKENMWFSEGYATYLSRKIMINQGIYTNYSFDSLYAKRIGGDANLFTDPHISIVDLCQQLKQNNHYSSIYYAGSSYFFLADRALKADHNMELIEVIQMYQKENRLADTNLSQVIASFDRLSDSKLFSELYTDFNEKACVDVLKPFRP